MARFTEDEQRQLQAANAIRSQIKAAARKREEQAKVDAEQAKKDEARAASLAAIEKARKEKADFDIRVRAVLVSLTTNMKFHGVKFLGDQFAATSSLYRSMNNKVPVLTVFDDKSKQQALVSWVYGKGFEW